MFVLQKQLSVLNVPKSRVAMIYRSGADIQLALPDMPSQMGSAYLVVLRGGGKVQVLVGLFLAKSRRNIFYLSDSGEVPAERVDHELQEGLIFAESMGFILNDTEFSRLTPEEQDAYWQGLPICQRHAANATAAKVTEPRGTALKSSETQDPPDVARAQSTPAAPPQLSSVTPVTANAALQRKRQILRERLGRFLASL